MKRSRIGLFGTSIAIAILAIAGQQSFAKSRFTTTWYRSSDGTVKSTSTSQDCTKQSVQCTIITNTTGNPVSHNLFLEQGLQTLAKHATV